MGVTAQGVTVGSGTIENDAEADIKAPSSLGVASVAFNSYGTTPILRGVGASGGAIRVKTTSGSGVPAIAANNVVVTLNTTRTPRKVFLAASNPAPGFHVSAVGAGTVTIGTKVAPVLSTVYDLELIVVY